MARINPVKLNHVSQDQLTALEKDKNVQKCRICGKSIWYETTKIALNKDGKLLSDHGGTTYRTSKTLYGKTYPISVCQHCLEKKYPDFKNVNKSRIFNTFNKYVSYAFDIPYEIINRKNKETAISLENFIRKYGENAGRVKFDEYRDKQAISNSFEYKKQKHGWTKEMFDDFNKSRAVTYENLINRYGLVEGTERWNRYVERQAETSTNEYLTEKFGEEYTKTINLCKAHSLDGLIKMHGEKIGREIYNNCNKQYSIESKLFFDDLVDILKKNGISYTFLYSENEYMIKTKNGYYLLDFYIPEINYVIEFYGDYWHCNPLKFHAEYIHPTYGIKAEDVWKIDELRMQDILEKMNCTFITLWESNVRQNKDGIIKELVEQIKNKEYVSENK